MICILDVSTDSRDDFNRELRWVSKALNFPMKNSPIVTWLVGLVVWNMAFMTFHSVGNVIIPTDELIFFRGVETTNQLFSWWYSPCPQPHGPKFLWIDTSLFEFVDS